MVRKFLSLLSVLLMSVTVAACNPAAIIGGGDTPIPIGQSTNLDEKALLGLEYSALTINQAVSIAVDTGILKPGSLQSVEIADKLVLIRNGVLAARAAHRAGNARERYTQMYQTLGLIADVTKLISG